MPFDHLHAPTDVALLVVLWRIRYMLSLRDLACRLGAPRHSGLRPK